jgi:hypothetical protein
VYGVVITLLGHWGEKHLVASPEERTHGHIPSPSPWAGLANLILINFVFLSLLPALILAVFQPMIPFFGARAGLALAVAALFFGIVPARLFDAPRQGWNRALWMILIDFVRVAGALTLVGWLLTG